MCVRIMRAQDMTQDDIASDDDHDDQDYGVLQVRCAGPPPPPRRSLCLKSRSLSPLPPLS